MWSRCDNWKIESFEATHFAGFWNALPAPKKPPGFDIAVRGLGIQGIQAKLLETLVENLGSLQIRDPPKTAGGYRVNKINHLRGDFGSLSAASPADAPTHVSAWHSFDCGWSFGRGPCCRCWWVENSILDWTFVWWTPHLATPNAPLVVWFSDDVTHFEAPCGWRWFALAYRASVIG